MTFSGRVMKIGGARRIYGVGNFGFRAPNEKRRNQPCCSPKPPNTQHESLLFMILPNYRNVKMIKK